MLYNSEIERECFFKVDLYSWGNRLDWACLSWGMFKEGKGWYTSYILDHKIKTDWNRTYFNKKQKDVLIKMRFLFLFKIILNGEDVFKTEHQKTIQIYHWPSLWRCPFQSVTLHKVFPKSALRKGPFWTTSIYANW